LDEALVLGGHGCSVSAAVSIVDELGLHGVRLDDEYAS
jgi:hypothetical protein